ncbi:LytTR family transcriptional regulator DNA-binding domain-containing protein [Anaerovorax odorimutans]|uniref:LytTR family transcriptional regulator DNA-binding domain-containing protein n=1 Tax=Anaerovorax odorimutans TaxID=109327 RepID=A0ABT1RNE6_9FIRM|nr:LytTR family transcriptional regulator DNA-binding domain-containing protein [Anaerovorax odorimutans]MCQ4636707.1 LytTR family transcriptional regulator DNA-binding domain-containing protein [Anaerovorax odorimutans]
MEREYKTTEELLGELARYGSIHIECSQEEEEEIRKAFLQIYGQRETSWILRTDGGYERQTVREYLRFFEQLSGSRRDCAEAMEEFELGGIKTKKLRFCTVSEHMRVNFARISLAENKLCFLENPLSNIDGESQKTILKWVGKQAEAGTKFVTTTPSLRHALLMPGTAFYKEDGRYIEAVSEEDGPQADPGEMLPQKIAAKSGSKTLLFEPKDIDYIESLNKANFLSVRNSTYQVSHTMDELEEMLKKFGFFRCHRSYIVNVQKVEEIEKWTKNSYSLRLNNSQHSQIPLAKGRVAEMKETYNW